MLQFLGNDGSNDVDVIEGIDEYRIADLVKLVYLFVLDIGIARQPCEPFKGCSAYVPGDDLPYHTHLFNDPGKLPARGRAPVLTLNQEAIQGDILLPICRHLGVVSPGFISPLFMLLPALQRINRHKLEALW